MYSSREWISVIGFSIFHLTFMECSQRVISLDYFISYNESSNNDKLNSLVVYYLLVRNVVLQAYPGTNMTM